ncbi:MAG TPA: hypothetical protein DDW28_05925 [Prevotella sp.]|nr:hypothetical protein [Candidatus Segatella violae]
MIYLIIALVVLGIISAILGIVSHKKGEEEEPLVEGVSCNTCNGENTKCEQECMMEAATKEIEYYDDEELDRFKGREADDYSDEEVEEFSEVLYTMKPEEVAGWNRSLILRGINLPNQLKDEVVGFLSEERRVKSEE